MGTTKRIRKLVLEGIHPAYYAAELTDDQINKLLETKGIEGEVITSEILEPGINLEGGYLRTKEWFLRRRKTWIGTLKKYGLFGPQFDFPDVTKRSARSYELKTNDGWRIWAVDPISAFGEYPSKTIDDVIQERAMRRSDIPFLEEERLTPSETYSLLRIQTDKGKRMTLYIVTDLISNYTGQSPLSNTQNAIRYIESDKCKVLKPKHGILSSVKNSSKTPGGKVV